MNAYETLGLATTSTEADVRKAYRKLAMKYHPDRGDGSNETKFKDIKAAFEEIEKAGFASSSQKPMDFGSQSRSWESPRSPADSWRSKPDKNEIFEEVRRANRNEPLDNSEIVARVAIRDAFLGFNMVVPRRTRSGVQNTSVHIPAGSPDGYRGRYKCHDDSSVVIITRIDAGEFKVRGFDDQNNLFSAGLNIGDIEIDMKLDAIDLISGAWISTVDFLGDKLEVRMPEGFNPLHRLKIAGRGYYGWLQEYNRPSNNRMDMFIKITPIFNKPSDIETAKKIIALHNSIQNAS